MIELTTSPQAERVFLAGLITQDLSRFEAELSLDELGNLAHAAGATVVGSELQKRPAPHPAFFFGSGKAREIGSLARGVGAGTLILDQDLTPAQERNLERTTRLKVLDRSELILDIFASRARTREARLQVELAQYQYLLPRLAGMWGHLSRTGGGIGTRGPGEAQLETDRRLVRTRLSSLKKRLRTVECHRRLLRSRRSSTYRVALVGYTNAGKSTLMNSLARTRLPVADQPFVTLDSITRKLYLGENLSVLITDTIGFVQRLPHHLVASFHSTLEEVREADLLLVVADAASPQIEKDLVVVDETLESIGAGEIEKIVVLNKMDLVGDQRSLQAMTARYEPGCLSVSALRRIGLSDLRTMMRSHAFATGHSSARPGSLARTSHRLW